MAEGKILFDPAMVENEEIQGRSEFGFWHCVLGLFGDLKGLAEEINQATEAAYAEKGVDL